MNLAKQVDNHYGQRLRQRVCGLCIQDDKLLLVEHKGLGPEGILWAPPGGGAEFGSSVVENLEREFLEETGFKVAVGDFLFLHEYLKPPLHAVELFFFVKVVGGTQKTGTDPEFSPDAQLIQHVSFMSWNEVKQKPSGQLHQILDHSSSLKDLLSMRGYYKFSV